MNTRVRLLVRTRAVDDTCTNDAPLLMCMASFAVEPVVERNMLQTSQTILENDCRARDRCLQVIGKCLEGELAHIVTLTIIFRHTFLH